MAERPSPAPEEAGGGLARAADTLARVSARWVPDSFSIACLLTLFTLGLGMTLGGAGPRQVVDAWGKGFWDLLAFAMQIAVVVFAGYMVAVSPAVTRLLDALARVPRTPRQVVAWTAFLSMVLCWVNWGLGLIASAVLVRFVARRHPDTDYRLLVAVAYLGMGTTWHAGPSGSVPLLLATPASFMIKDGLIAAPIPLSQTVFTPLNLTVCLVVTLGLAAFVALLHPPKSRVVRADRASLDALSAFAAPTRPAAPTPAERVMHSGWPNRLVGAVGLLYMALHMRAVGARASS